MTEAKCASEFMFTKDTPYLVFMDVFGEDLGENWSSYNGKMKTKPMNLWYFMYMIIWRFPGELNKITLVLNELKRWVIMGDCEDVILGTVLMKTKQWYFATNWLGPSDTYMSQWSGHY